MIAGIWRIAQGKREARNLLLFAGAAVATLFLVSPYLLLDYPAVVRNLTGEARPMHPGSTAGGLLDNFRWYLGSLLGSFGVANVALAVLGTILLGLRKRGPAIALLPGVCAFAVLISIQALRWERWLVPLLPFVAIMAGYAVHVLAEMARAGTGRPLQLAELFAGLLLILPMLPPVQDRAVARANDTRQLASAWIRAHVPSDASIVVEHAALDLIDGPWKLLFPLGSAGCVDARAMLTGRIRYAEVETLRSGSPIVDLASVPPARLESCRARYAVLTHFDRYRDAQADFASEWRRYAALTRGGTLRAVITPADGQRAGPSVRAPSLGKRVSGIIRAHDSSPRGGPAQHERGTPRQCERHDHVHRQTGTRGEPENRVTQRHPRTGEKLPLPGDRAVFAPCAQRRSEPRMIEEPGLELRRRSREAADREDQKDRRRHQRQKGAHEAQQDEEPAQRQPKRA
jgi:hypothetical protein